MIAVPHTAAWRGKRHKVRFGCRLCRRERRVFYLRHKYAGRGGKNDMRWYCD